MVKRNSDIILWIALNLKVENIKDNVEAVSIQQYYFDNNNNTFLFITEIFIGSVILKMVWHRSPPPFLKQVFALNKLHTHVTVPPPFIIYTCLKHCS